MGIIIINSNVPARLRMCSDGKISPHHHLGYVPKMNDTLLWNRQNRYEITFRHKFCKGTDPRVVVQTIWGLMRGAKGVYSVSQPDVMRAIPLLKRLFPKKPIATWIWTAREARANEQYLRPCDHVFALTNQGLEELKELGLGGRCSLGILGCDPGAYYLAEGNRPEVESDFIFFGLTSRDVQLVRKLVAADEFSILAPKQSIAAIGSGLGLKEVKANSHAELLQSIYSAWACLVPLTANEPEPAGYTNLTESLLCGTSVVIADSSIIPKEVLNLAGVHRYRAGDLDSLQNTCRQAVAENKQPGRRDEIRRQAAQVLNGRRLNAEILQVLGLA